MLGKNAMQQPSAGAAEREAAYEDTSALEAFLQSSEKGTFIVVSAMM